MDQPDAKRESPGIPQLPEAPDWALGDKPGASPGRTWLLIGLAFVLFWVLYLAFFGPRNHPALESSGMSQPAAYDWSLLDLKDQPVRFSRFQGKPLFLNIWATWCGPCVEEMPSIARLADHPKLKGKGFEFVCVSTDNSSEDVRRFLAGKGWSMTFLRAEKLPGVFLTDGIPATFIIAADGRIAAAQIGSTEWDGSDVVNFLEKIAATKPAP
jgi:thiol-disulfide isomerase/thioredoxin